MKYVGGVEIDYETDETHVSKLSKRSKQAKTKTMKDPTQSKSPSSPGKINVNEGESECYSLDSFDEPEEHERNYLSQEQLTFSAYKGMNSARLYKWIEDTHAKMCKAEYQHEKAME